MQKVSFKIYSIVDEQNCFLEHYENEDFKSFSALSERIEKREIIKDYQGHEMELLRFKNGGYGFYESFDKSETPKKVLKDNKEVFISHSADIEIYISKSLEDILLRFRYKFELSEEKLKNIARKEDRFVYE